MKIKDVIALFILAKFLNAYSTRPIEILNGFLIAYGYLMKDPRDYSVFTMTSLAACRMRCVTLNASCLTVSMFKRDDGSVECRLSNNVVHEIHFNNVKGGFTFAKVTSFQHYLGHDGMFYDMIKADTNWTAMESSCTSTYKTGRSLMLKYMDQIMSLSDYESTQFQNDWANPLYFNLNLTYSIKLGANIWGDGTLLTETESGKQATIVQGMGTKTFEFQQLTPTSWQFYGQSTWRTTWTICQMNPFNFD